MKEDSSPIIMLVQEVVSNEMEGVKSANADIEVKHIRLYDFDDATRACSVRRSPSVFHCKT